TLVVTTDKLSALSATTSAELAGVISDETGTGSIVLSVSPAFTGTPTLPTGTIGVTQTAGNNTTALATTAFVTAANATNANLTGDVTSVGNATTLSNTSVIANTYGSATTVPVFSVDAKGRVTGVTNTTITGTSPVGSALTSSNILVGNASNAAAAVAMSGDITISSTGVTSIGNDKVVTADILNSNVTYAKIQNVSGTNMVLGRTSAGAGVVEEIATTGSGNVVRATSPVLISPSLGTPTALVGTNITGTATAFTASNVTTNANLTGMVTSVGNTTSLGSFTSANLLAAVTDETGTGVVVFSNSPTFTGAPLAPTPTTGDNSSKIATTAFVTAAASLVREVADEFTATDSQTSFTLTQTPSTNSKVKMYINGIRISNSAYTVNENILTYNPTNNGAYALSAGDRVQMDFYR
ncbi:hypothetical protein AAGV33_11305, partial [Flavobacterium sp. FBOR7N2.3]